MKTGGTVFLHFFFSSIVCIYYSATEKNLSLRTRGLLRELQTKSGRGRNIQSISAWFSPTCLFVLRASFGMHGVKTIINGGIESFNSADLLGQTQSWEFICLCCSESEAGRGLDSVIPGRKMIQTRGSHYLGNFVNNIVKF